MNDQKHFASLMLKDAIRHLGYRSANAPRDYYVGTSDTDVCQSMIDAVAVLEMALANVEAGANIEQHTASTESELCELIQKHDVFQKDNEHAMIGDNGEWEEVTLAEAMQRAKSGELYECSLCNERTDYDDNLRTFHPNR